MPLLIRYGRYNWAALQSIAKRHQQACRAQAERLCIVAGIGPYVGNHLHNALCDEGSRKGWGAQVTDWRKLHRARWLMDTEGMRGYRLIDALYKRRGPDAFNWS